MMQPREKGTADAGKAARVRPRARLFVVDELPACIDATVADLRATAGLKLLYAMGERQANDLLDDAPPLIAALIAVNLDGDPSAGLRIAARLGVDRPWLPIAMLATGEDAAIAPQVESAGLSLIRQADAWDLHRWVARAARTVRLQNEHLAHAVYEMARRWQLTCREVEVLHGGLERDPDTMALARAFGLTRATMSTHFKHIAEKAGMPSFRAAIGAIHARATSHAVAGHARARAEALAYRARVDTLEATLARRDAQEARHRRARRLQPPPGGPPRR